MRKNKIINIVYNPDTKEGFIELSNNEKVNFSFDKELFSWFQWGASTETLTETQPIVEKLFKIDCHLLPPLVKNGDYYKIKLDIPKHKIPNNEIGG